MRRAMLAMVVCLSIVGVPGLHAAVDLPVVADVYVVNNTELQVKLGRDAALGTKALLYGARAPGGDAAPPLFEFGFAYGLKSGCDAAGACIRVMKCDLFVPNAERDGWIKVEDTGTHQRYVSEKLGYAVDMEYVEVPAMARELYVTASPLANHPRTALAETRTTRISYQAR